jgi:hypothetical protein
MHTEMNMPAKRSESLVGNQYTVNHWGSHPDKEEDNCWTGDDFLTLEGAKASDLYQSGSPDTEYIVLDGPGIHEVRMNPTFNPKTRAASNAADRSEYAMQQGMGLGIHAYNEAMGGDSEEAPCSSEDERAYYEWKRDQQREAEG